MGAGLKETASDSGSSEAPAAFQALDVYVRSTHLGTEEQEELRARNLKPVPNGLHILISGATGRVVEPVLFFMRDKCIRRLLPGEPNELRKSANTRKTMAYDLKDFLDFLDAKSLTIDAIDVTALNSYVSSMRTHLSPVTGRPYKDNTIIRRLSTTKLFCKWAQDKGLLRHRIRIEEVDSKRPIDSIFLAHIDVHRSKQESFAELDVPRTPDMGEGVTTLSPDEVQCILAALGPPVPIASLGEKETSLEGSSVRDRLMASFGLYVGLRRAEVCDIELSAVDSIRISDDTPSMKLQLLRVLGKGNKWRKVNVPTWLLLALRHYIATERAKVVAKAREKNPNYIPPNRVFLNRLSARTGLGTPVAPKTLGQIFHDAQLRLNSASAPESLAAPGFKAPVGFHVLRHTFAVWTYIYRKHDGDADPIKYIQAQLGHVYYSTTSDTYLKYSVSAETRLYDVFFGAQKVMMGRTLGVNAHG